MDVTPTAIGDRYRKLDSLVAGLTIKLRYEAFFLFEVSDGRVEMVLRISSLTSSPPSKEQVLAHVSKSNRLQFTDTQTGLLSMWTKRLLSRSSAEVTTLKVHDRKIGATTVLATLVASILATFSDVCVEFQCDFRSNTDAFLDLVAGMIDPSVGVVQKQKRVLCVPRHSAVMRVLDVDVDYLQLFFHAVSAFNALVAKQQEFKVESCSVGHEVVDAVPRLLTLVRELAVAIEVGDICVIQVVVDRLLPFVRELAVGTRDHNDSYVIPLIDCWGVLYNRYFPR
jgi:hypothetical protein